MVSLGLALALQGTTRTIAIDERLATDASLHVGDRVVVASTPGAAGDTVIVGAILSRRADPSEIARDEYRVRLHLDHLQELHADFGGRMVARLKDAGRTELPVSRERVRELKGRLGL